MSKVAVSRRLPPKYDIGKLTELFAQLEDAINGMAEEKIAYKYKAATAAPTTGSWAQGDFVRKAAPVEAGSAASKYIIMGWVCVASGTPGTWREARVLTGN